MLNNTNSYRAFSFMETIISMVISGIVVGLLFLIFSILTERMLDFKIQNQEIADLNRFTFSVNKDIFDNNVFTVEDTTLNFISYSGSKTEYHLSTDYVIRNSKTFTDTFKIHSGRFFMDSLKSRSGKLIFCKLQLDATVNESQVKLNFYKQIYADQLLELRP